MAACRTTAATAKPWSQRALAATLQVNGRLLLPAADADRKLCLCCLSCLSCSLPAWPGLTRLPCVARVYKCRCPQASRLATAAAVGTQRGHVCFAACREKEKASTASRTSPRPVPARAPSLYSSPPPRFDICVEYVVVTRQLPPAQACASRQHQERALALSLSSMSVRSFSAW